MAGVCWYYCSSVCLISTFWIGYTWWQCRDLRIPPNSDIDYRIFNVCTRSFLCVHIHTRGWAHRHLTSQLNIFNSEKLTFFLRSWRDSNLGSLDLESDALPVEPPRHPLSYLPVAILLAPVSRLGPVGRRSAGKRKDADLTPRFGSPFSSKIVIVIVQKVVWHRLVTLPFTINETLKGLTSLAHLNAEIILGWWQCGG